MILKRGNTLIVALVIYCYAISIIMKFNINRSEEGLFKKYIGRIEDRIIMEGIIIDHFCFKEEEFKNTYKDYEITASINDNIVDVSIIGPFEYHFSYDIMEDGSFIVKL